MKILKQKTLKQFVGQAILMSQQVKIKGGTDGDGEIVIEDVVNE